MVYQTDAQCLISHDLFFIREIANHIVEVDNGVLREYPGGLDYYLEKKQGRMAEDEDRRKAAARRASEEQKKIRRSQESEPEHLRQARDKHEQALKRVQQIKNEIKNLEKEEKELETN